MYNLQNLLKCFQGETVNILAGPQKKRFLVHQEALNLSGSASLRTLVSGQWSESKSQIIDWCHTDVDTVARVCTFLYTGDYETPLPKVRADVSLSTAEEEGKEECVDDDARREAGGEMEVALEQEEVIVLEPELAVPEDEVIQEENGAPQDDDIESRADVQDTLPLCPRIRPLTPITGIVQNEVDDEESDMFDIKRYPYANFCFVDMLLAHAKLYAFAKYHQYPMLINLALRRLIEALNHLQCEEEHSAYEVAALADFIYEHVGSDSADEEPLRKVISHFVATNFTALARSELETTLGLGGDFTLDVLRKVSRCLKVERQLMESLKQDNASLEQRVQDLTIVEDQPPDSSFYVGSSSSRRRRARM